MSHLIGNGGPVVIHGLKRMKRLTLNDGDVGRKPGKRKGIGIIAQARKFWLYESWSKKSSGRCGEKNVRFVSGG